MLMMKERRAAIRTLQGWATSVLLEAGAILECEEHSWLKERTDPDAWARPCRRSAGSAARRLAGGVGDARCRRVELFGFRPIQLSPAFAWNLLLLKLRGVGRILDQGPRRQQSEEDESWQSRS
jgi:hypothetical protein